MFLNLIIAFSMVYVANKSRDFEKLNNTLLNKINDTNEDLNINLIEYTIHHNYDYLQTLHSIYFENYTLYNNPNLITINQLDNENHFNLVRLNN